MRFFTVEILAGGLMSYYVICVCLVHLYLQLFVGGLMSYYVICVCLRIVVSNTCCVMFYFVCLRIVYSMLPVSLDCPYLITPSVFSSVYLLPLRFSLTFIGLFILIFFFRYTAISCYINNVYIYMYVILCLL